MGLYDTLILVPPYLKKLTCEEGHIVTSLQTKSLGEGMQEFYLINKILYRQTQEQPFRFVKSGDVNEGKGTIVVRKECVALRQNHNEFVVGYTHCNVCEPVITQCTTTHDFTWSGSGTQHHPWVQFKMRFENGVLKSVESDGSQTRAELKKKLIAQGSLLMPEVKIPKKRVKRK